MCQDDWEYEQLFQGEKWLKANVRVVSKTVYYIHGRSDKYDVRTEEEQWSQDDTPKLERVFSHITIRCRLLSQLCSSILSSRVRKELNEIQ